MNIDYFNNCFKAFIITRIYLQFILSFFLTLIINRICIQTSHRTYINYKHYKNKFETLLANL
jgi:hypothetical protein